MNGPRIACLFVPDFPLAVFRRGAPDDPRRPIVLLDAERAEAPIVAVTPCAWKRGVRPGLSLAQGRALFPGLLARPRDLEEEQIAQRALLEAAEAFSPIVEEEGPGIVYLDLTGVRDERGLADAVVERTAAAGLPARVGIAGSRLTARVAAQRSRRGAAIVRSGEEGSYLSPLPIAYLPMSGRWADTFARWGIDSIGALAALPTAEVAGRLGQEGVELQRSARGIESRPLIGRRPPLRFSEGADLDWSLTEMEPFLSLARRALERIFSRLGDFGLVCRALLLTLRLDPIGEEARTLRLPAPTGDIKTLLALLKGEVESRPPGAPIKGFTLDVVPEPPRRVQSSLFGPAVHSADLLATMMARLSALLGPDRVGAPKRVEGHRPERFAIQAYAPPPPPKFGSLPERGRVGLSVRLLRPGVPLEVKTKNGPFSEPVTVRSVREKTRHPEISGKVRVASGPWKLEEGWWLEEPVMRDYWDVALSDGGVYRIFYDPRKGGWVADGVYG